MYIIYIIYIIYICINIYMFIVFIKIQCGAQLIPVSYDQLCLLVYNPTSSMYLPEVLVIRVMITNLAIDQEHQNCLSRNQELN